MPGKLFVIATPLGNLGDLSARAVDTLRSVDRIACEDTRRTAKLLARYSLAVPLLSCHRFNEAERIESILGRLRSGESIALVSDGGTPGVSDPGAQVVRAALDEGLVVSPIPGPSAVATLLSVSGLHADRYVFEGFLPQRAGERRRRLRELAGETRTLVIFESPRRVGATLTDIGEILGDRRLVLGRELTKINETVLVGTAEELREGLGAETRGEITLAVAGADPAAAVQPADTRAQAVLDCWNRALAATGGDRRAALRRTARELGLQKAELYRTLAELGCDG